MAVSLLKDWQGPDRYGDDLLLTKFDWRDGLVMKWINKRPEIGKENTFERELLGAPALLPNGPFKIAAKCRVPVVFYYAMREKGRTYRFIFEEPKCEERISAEELASQYAASLERIVEKYPRQWFNFYDFWNIN